MNVKDDVFIGVGLAILFLSSFLLGYIVHSRDINLLSISGKFSPDITEYQECANKSIESTSVCLRDYVSTFFNYTVRDESDKTIEDIKANGGDCYDYSMIYIKMARELGFQAHLAVFRVSDNSSHAVAILGDDNKYCVMDQLINPHCVELAG